VTQLTPTPSKRPSGQTLPVRSLNDEMPDPDNLRIDRTDLMTLPIRVTPAPSIGERLSPARHRAEYTRSA
jgi:hypothetical protein